MKTTQVALNKQKLRDNTPGLSLILNLNLKQLTKHFSTTNISNKTLNIYAHNKNS